MKHKNGQALLIIVLIMAVALTIGLAVVSRSVTDIRISKQEEDSARVFSVAEAGIEKALMAGLATSTSVGSITAQVKKVSQGGGDDFVFPQEIEAGSTQTLWLVEHQGAELDPDTYSYSGDAIEIYWGKDPLTGTVPALEVILLYKSGDFKVARFALDPDSGRGNGFDSSNITNPEGSENIGGKNFLYKKTLTLPAGTKYALRLKFFYNNKSQILGVKKVGGAGVKIPTQGSCYESTATDSLSNITRKVKQCQFFQSPPGIFDYGLYSGGDLSK